MLISLVKYIHRGHAYSRLPHSESDDAIWNSKLKKHRLVFSTVLDIRKDFSVLSLTYDLFDSLTTRANMRLGLPLAFHISISKRKAEPHLHSIRIGAQHPERLSSATQPLFHVTARELCESRLSAPDLGNEEVLHLDPWVRKPRADSGNRRGTCSDAHHKFVWRRSPGVKGVKRICIQMWATRKHFRNFPPLFDISLLAGGNPRQHYI